MEEKRIIIVEDEAIVSNDLNGTLKRFGYQIIANFNSGEELLKEIKNIKPEPDLILMDIRLNGKIDGITAAEEIKKEYNIPVIFLTAFCDQDTLQRVKLTSASGYIIKPYNEKELYTSIELALYKYKMEKNLKEREEWIKAILKSIGDAVIATDSKGHILFMNPKAEKLTGWAEEEAKGKKMNTLFRILHERENLEYNNENYNSNIKISEHLVLISKDGDKIKIRENATPIIDEKGKIKGIVIVFNRID